MQGYESFSFLKNEQKISHCKSKVNVHFFLKKKIKDKYKRIKNINHMYEERMR